ncbi:MAG TPA: DEAD/DEAH box helicase [Tepidisphaeraceae bacterium]|nr:DEAD/DEAH box helicase [Tepidisphaeraceae bacterium]
MQFSDLRLAEPLLRAVASEGYSVATPVQAKAIPLVLAGNDVLGVAQTGTGKTAAFALPILHRLSAGPRPGGHPRVRVLVLCPTRELATQVGDSFRTYGKHTGVRHAVVFGGVGQNPQVAMIRSGVEVLVATPGRLLDLMNQGHVDLRGIEVLVLDEADRMLDMGFIHDIRKIVAKIPANRQTLFFSATMPREIRQLADALLRDPVSVEVAKTNATAEGIAESVYFVSRQNKPALLAHLVDSLPMSRAIVFSRTKHGADKVVRRLHASGIKAEAIHGNKSQNARERALKNFKAGKIPVLVATDIASRGIDVDGITHVVNYDLTHEPETYVHRIGRTARAGASGAALSFCDPEEVQNLKAIERLIRRPIPVKTEHPRYLVEAAAEYSRPHERPQSRAHASERSQASERSHNTPERRHARPVPAAQPTRGPAGRSQFEAHPHQPKPISKPVVHSRKAPATHPLKQAAKHATSGSTGNESATGQDGGRPRRFEHRKGQAGRGARRPQHAGR